MFFSTFHQPFHSYSLNLFFKKKFSVSLSVTSTPIILIASLIAGNLATNSSPFFEYVNFDCDLYSFRPRFVSSPKNLSFNALCFARSSYFSCFFLFFKNFILKLNVDFIVLLFTSSALFTIVTASIIHSSLRIFESSSSFYFSYYMGRSS